HTTDLDTLSLPDALPILDAVRPVALIEAVQQPLDDPVGAGLEVVVHQIAAEHAARVGEPVRKAGRLGVEQDSSRVERRGADKHQDRKSTRLNSSHEWNSY